MELQFLWQTVVEWAMAVRNSFLYDLNASEKVSVLSALVTSGVGFVIARNQQREIRYSQRIENLTKIIRSIRAERYHYAREALAYYRRMYRDGTQQMVVDKTIFQKGWVQDPQDPHFPRLSDVTLRFDGPGSGWWNSRTNAKPSFLPTAREGYAENAKFHCGVNLMNLPLYGLGRVEVQPSDRGARHITLDIVKGRYFDFYDTCEVLSAEMAYHWRICHKRLSRSRLLRLRNRNGDLLRLNGRFAGIGVNALTVLKNVEDDSGKRHTYFLVHQRSSTQVAEGCGSFHVVPAGSYQPASVEFPQQPEAVDYNLENTVIREFYEELCGKMEFDTLVTSELLQNHEELLGEIYFLGVCFDPLNTKTEVLASVIIDVADSTMFSQYQTKEALEHYLKDSYEGKFMLHRLDKAHILQYRDNPMSIPAFAQILQVVWEHQAFFGVEGTRPTAG